MKGGVSKTWGCEMQNVTESQQANWYAGSAGESPSTRRETFQHCEAGSVGYPGLCSC